MKRQKSVQEQITKRKEHIAELAMQFKVNPEDSQWLVQLLDNNNMNFEDGILVELKEVVEQGPIYDCMAIWLTNQKTFIQLSGEADYQTKELLEETTKPKDITNLIELNEQKSGIGKTFAALAIEVLEELTQ